MCARAVVCVPASPAAAVEPGRLSAYLQQACPLLLGCDAGAVAAALAAVEGSGDGNMLASFVTEEGRVLCVCLRRPDVAADGMNAPSSLRAVCAHAAVLFRSARSVFHSFL